MTFQQECSRRLRWVSLQLSILWVSAHDCYRCWGWFNAFEPPRNTVWLKEIVIGVIYAKLLILSICVCRNGNYKSSGVKSNVQVGIVEFAFNHYYAGGNLIRLKLPGLGTELNLLKYLSSPVFAWSQRTCYVFYLEDSCFGEIISELTAVNCVESAFASNYVAIASYNCQLHHKQ